MGTEQVSNSASRNSGGDKNAPIFYTKIFEDLCPFYMSIGMAYNDYWYGDCDLVKMYLKAYQLKIEREQHQANYNNWLMGAYIYEIVTKLAPIFNPFIKGKCKPYRAKPLPITQEEIDREEQQARNKRLLLLKDRLQASVKES